MFNNMLGNITSSSRKLISRTVRKKSLLERIPGVSGLSQKVRNLWSSIGGVVFGFVLVLVGFVLIFGSVKWVKEYSVAVAQLVLEDANSVKKDAGLVKMQGKPVLANDFKYTYHSCLDDWCEMKGEEQSIENIVYYEARIERICNVQ